MFYFLYVRFVNIFSTHFAVSSCICFLGMLNFSCILLRPKWSWVSSWTSFAPCVGLSCSFTYSRLWLIFLDNTVLVVCGPSVHCLASFWSCDTFYGFDPVQLLCHSFILFIVSLQKNKYTLRTWILLWTQVYMTSLL